MNDDHLPHLRVEPVGSEHQREALALAFADLEPARRARHVAWLRAEHSGNAIEGLWAAYRGPRMVGAMRAAAMAGKAALVTVPRVAPDEPPETARQLLAAAVKALPSQGVRLAQALLETDHGPDAAVLTGGGFAHAGDLLFLVSLRPQFPDAPPARQLDFVPYRPDLHRRLTGLVEQTYVGSLDCPAMDGVRQVDDVLAGYRAACAFDPDLWLIVRHAGADVGCLLLSAQAPSAECELTYMGVVPAARGRGFGLALTRHAQWLARKAACSRLTLAVDADNQPAQRVYAAAGFTTWDRRSMFLRVF